MWQITEKFTKEKENKVLITGFSSISLPYSQRFSFLSDLCHWLTAFAIISPAKSLAAICSYTNDPFVRAFFFCQYGPRFLTRQERAAVHYTLLYFLLYWLIRVGHFTVTIMKSFLKIQCNTPLLSVSFETCGVLYVLKFFTEEGWRSWVFDAFCKQKDSYTDPSASFIADLFYCF